MRKFIKEQILEIFKTLYEAHSSVKVYIEKKEYDNAVAILGECQNAAVQIGDTIDNSEGEGSPVIHLLEEYCETVYQVSIELNEGITGTKSGKMLDRSLLKAENSVKNDIVVKTEIVFMPYNASMWDSLESVWKTANDDPDCDVYVVPIPYYERNPDQSLGTYHYEGDRFPEYVPITHYNTYDFASRRPDAIYIHNPYDGNNFITTVDSRFYSTELKKYTDMLVYIPYFVLEDREKWDDKYLDNIEKFALVPAVMNADRVIVQSENMRKIYIRTLLKYCGSSKEELLDYTQRVVGIGSPKFDRLYEQAQKSSSLCDIWRKKAGDRKILFFNTNIKLILHNTDHFIENLQRTFESFERHKKDIYVIWREHPLSEATVGSLGEEMMNNYENIKNEFTRMGIGDLDTSPEPYEAMLCSDCYFGAGGSLLPLYSMMGKPLMMINYYYPQIAINKNITLELLKKWSQKCVYLSDRYINTLELYLENIDSISEFFINKSNVIDMDECSSSVGDQIYFHIKGFISSL